MRVHKHTRAHSQTHTHTATGWADLSGDEITRALEALLYWQTAASYTHTHTHTHTHTLPQSIQCPVTLMRGLKARHTCARVIREDFIATLQATTLHYCTSLVTLLENSGFSKSGSGTTRTPSTAQGSSSLNNKKRDRLPVFLYPIYLTQHVARKKGSQCFNSDGLALRKKKKKKKRKSNFWHSAVILTTGYLLSL